MCIYHDTRSPERCFYKIAQEAHSLQSFAGLWWETSKWKMNSVTLLSFSFVLKASQQTSGEGELFQLLYLLPIVRDALCHAQLSLNRNGQRRWEELLLLFYRGEAQTYNCSQLLGRLDITRNWMQPPEMQSRCFPAQEAPKTCLCLGLRGLIPLKS